MGANGKVCIVISHEILACFCLNLDPNSYFVCDLDICWIKMVITWREREHEEEDMIALHDQGIVTALRNCGLLKFFRIYSMRKQISLLQYFLDAWDPINQEFQIRGKSIPLTVEDIYFLMGLSRRGAPLSLLGSAHGGELVRDYIRQLCRDGS